MSGKKDKRDGDPKATRVLHSNDIFIAVSEVIGIGWTLVAWLSGAHWAWVTITIFFNCFCVYLIFIKYTEVAWRKSLSLKNN